MAVIDLDDLSGSTFGDFVLGERIDEGGFGVVYRATQRLLRREAVIKVLNPARRTDGAARRRFLREAQLASRLDHPYATQVFAFGAREGEPMWIAMEFVDGVTLERWLRKRKFQSLTQFVSFFGCLAEVVQSAHELEIVHRDLKPSNIMVIERSERLLPKLLDLGIASLLDTAAAADTDDVEEIAFLESDGTAAAADTDATLRQRPDRSRSKRRSTEAGLGSPPFMAPECWSMESSIGREADLYALGVIAYEAITGRRPFKAATEEGWALAHCRAAVPPVGQGLPAALDRFFERALAKRPADRYASALEMAAALRSIAKAEPDARLRAAALQWDRGGRSSDLLWRGSALAECALGSLGERRDPLEFAFIAASRREEQAAADARRRRRTRVIRGALLASAAAALAAFQYDSYRRAEVTRVLAEASITTSALERGRQALLYGELGEARLQLGEAIRRGDSSAPTAFMHARAMDPVRAELASFTAASGRMWSAAWSPDGRNVVTADDSSAQIFDAASGRLLLTLPHGGAVYAAEYTRDGARVITASGDGAVRIWDAATGALVRSMGTAGRRYFRLAVSHDGELVAAIDGDGSIAQVWLGSNGTEIASWTHDGSGFPELVFSADGRWIATTGGDEVRVVETATWIPTTIAARRVRALAWDPHGDRLLTGAVDGGVSIWSVTNGDRLRVREVGEAIDRVAFSPNGELVAHATSDGAVHISDAATGVPRTRANSRHGRVQALEFSPASTLTLAAGTDGTVTVADVEQGIVVSELQGPVGVVAAASWDPTGRRIVGASWDGAARVWDATPSYRRWSAQPLADECGVVTGAEVDRRFVAVGCAAKPTRVWDTERGELLAELPAVTPVAGDYLSALPAVSADGDRAAIALGDRVAIYDLPSGREVRSIRHGAAVNAVAFAPTGRDVISSAVDGSVLVTRDGAESIAMPSADAGIDTVALLEDGRALMTAGKQMRIIDVAARAVRAELELPSRTMALRPSTNGRSLITIPHRRVADLDPVLVDLVDYRVNAKLDGHVGRVFNARWAGDQILTAGADGSVRTWDGATGQSAQVFRHGQRALTDATLSPDGSMLVAGGDDGMLRFWDARSVRPLWSLPAHRSYVFGIRWVGSSIVSRGFGGELSQWFIPAM